MGYRVVISDSDRPLNRQQAISLAVLIQKYLHRRLEGPAFKIGIEEEKRRLEKRGNPYRHITEVEE